MFTERIETPRLILRPFTLEDIPASFEMEQDPDINQYTNDGGVKSYSEIENLIKTVINVDYQENGFGRFAMELKETSEFIGFSGLKYLRETDEVDLGYRLKKKYWGKGLATESCIASIKFGFETLKLEKIVAYFLPENERSKRVLEKLNFHFHSATVEDGVLVHKYELLKKGIKRMGNY